MQFLRFIGSLASNFLVITKFLFRGQVIAREFITHSANFIYSVIGPVIVVCIALGVVIGIQLGPEFVEKGLGAQMGVLAMLTILRELGPVVGSLMIATQYGTGISAELANMKISEQVDALKVLRINPLYYLVVPRFLVMIVFTPLVIWIASMIGVASTFLVVYFREGVRLTPFMSSIWIHTSIKEIAFSCFKSSIFGGLIMLIASTIGLNTEGGAKEVGKASTSTVIITFVTIVLVDFLIGAIYLD